MRCRVGHREITGEHGVDVADDVGTARREYRAWAAEPGADERVRVALVCVGSKALPGAPARTQVAADDLADLVVWDRRIPGPLRLGPTFHGVHDEGERTARFEDVVDGFGDGHLVGPLERLAERHEPERPEIERRDCFRDRLDPADVVDARFARATCALGEHVGIGIEADRLLERWRELDREDAGPASDVEQPSGSVEAHFVGQRRDELTRIRRTAGGVVTSVPSVDRRVVRHRSVTLRVASGDQDGRDGERDHEPYQRDDERGAG